jgi:hypothetical protein
MNSVALENAIRARLVASAAAEGVTTQGVYSTIAPPGKEIKQGANPLIVFELLQGLFDDTFSENGIVCTYRVNIYDHRGNGTTNAKPLYDAVIGNGTPDSAPTKGLHRWQATVSGQNILQARMTRFGYGHAGDMLHYWADFEIYAEEA